MPKRSYAVYISPMHAVHITREDFEIVQNVLQFKKDGKVCAQFSQYMGWTEIVEETKAPGSVTYLTPVDTSPPGSAA